MARLTVGVESYERRDYCCLALMLEKYSVSQQRDLIYSIVLDRFDIHYHKYILLLSKRSRKIQISAVHKMIMTTGIPARFALYVTVDPRSRSSTLSPMRDGPNA